MRNGQAPKGFLVAGSERGKFCCINSVLVEVVAQIRDFRSASQGADSDPSDVRVVGLARALGDCIDGFLDPGAKLDSHDLQGDG